MTYVLKALKLEYTLDSIKRNMQTAKTRTVFKTGRQPIFGAVSWLLMKNTAVLA